MKFTPSKDGVDRTTVCIRLRFTKDEIEEIKQKALAVPEDWRAWLESHAALGIEEQLIYQGGEYLQRYGKGDA